MLPPDEALGRGGGDRNLVARGQLGSRRVYISSSDRGKKSERAEAVDRWLWNRGEWVSAGRNPIIDTRWDATPRRPAGARCFGIFPQWPGDFRPSFSFSRCARWI